VTHPTSRGISETDVWQAADALLLEGARPTIERVRLKIGRGSPNTVSPYLETWFKHLGARIADPHAFSAPPALPDPISQAATYFWEAAMTQARAEVAAALEAGHAELDTVRRELEVERAHLHAEAAKSAVQVQAKEEALELMRVRAADTQSRIDTLAVEVDERNRTILELRGDMARLQADRDALRGQLDSERATFEADRKALDAREVAQASHWAAEVDRARESTKAAVARATLLEKEMGARVEHLSRALMAAEAEQRRVTDENTEMQRDAQRLCAARAADSTAFAEALERAHAREAQLLAQTERVQTQLTDALEQLAAKDREHGALLRSLVAESKENSRGSRRGRAPPPVD
jgi:chromosome segregation ATPase